MWVTPDFDSPGRYKYEGDSFVYFYASDGDVTSGWVRKRFWENDHVPAVLRGCREAYGDWQRKRARVAEVKAGLAARAGRLGQLKAVK